MTTNWLLAGCALAAATAARADPPPATAPPPAAQDDFTGERETFARAVARSLERNPQVAIASEELVRVRAQLEQVRAASLPTLTANGVYTRLDDDRRLNGAIVAPENQLSGNLQLAVPLVAPRPWAQWAHARAAVRTQADAYLDARRQIAVAAGRAYLTVLVQRKVVEVSRSARDAARAAHQFAQARLAGGVGTRIDEVRAAQELATDEAQLTNARTQLRRAREALGVLAGAEGPVDAVEEPALPGRDDLGAALTDVGRRPDVRAATSRRDDAHRVTRDSFVDYLPLVTGVFQPFLQDPPTLTVPKAGWQAQLVLALPIFDGGLRYGQRRERSALEAQARAQLEAVLRQARSDVRPSFEAVRDADRALGAAREAAALAREALGLATTAYRAGAATNLELIDAERHARDADTAAAIAEDTARQARLDLLAAAGQFP